MTALFLDTASSRVIVSIVQDSKILFYKNEKNDNNLSNKIMVYIEEAFDKTSISANDLDKIFVVNGPGSFTGIRCGVTVAKVMAYLVRCDVVALSELEVMSSGSNGNVCSVIDARRGYVYGGIYNNLDVIKADSYIDYSELVDNYNGLIVSYDNYGIEPIVDILKVIEKHKNDIVDVHKLVPNYLKLTEAEENLNDKRD